MDKLLKGVLKYRQRLKPSMVDNLKKATCNPDPKAVFLTCVDSRLQPSAFTQTEPGDMFIARTVGNCARRFRPGDLRVGLRLERHRPCGRLRPFRLQGHDRLEEPRGVP